MTQNDALFDLLMTENELQSGGCFFKRGLHNGHNSQYTISMRKVIISPKQVLSHSKNIVVKRAVLPNCVIICVRKSSQPFRSFF